MENEAIQFEQMCRRLRRLRTEAIRQTVDGRYASLHELGGSLADGEKVNRDVTRRVLRAIGGTGIESK